MARVASTKKTEAEIIQEKYDKMMNAIDERCSFYRANPHRFVEDYLNVKLKRFQQILLCMMNICHYFMYIAARGQGKTFLTALFCCVRCILYPGTMICIASGKRKQAKEVLDKITGILMPRSVNLTAEIKKVSINQSEAYIEFHNTSKIQVVTSTDSSRGARANILIVDEFRIVPLEIINTVLRKFLTAPRNPGYLDKPEYSHLSERNKELYLSSAWYKSHWSFEKAKAYCSNLINDTKKYFICGLPYQLSIKENLLSKAQVEDEMSEADFNELSWLMEMEALWFSDTDGSLFTFNDVSKTRRIEHAVLPPEITDKYSLFKNSKIPNLARNERRILSADVALLASKKQNNDAASIFINSAIPNSQGRYTGNFIYTENHEGLHTSELALIIRRLFEQYYCTDIALDVKGLGLGVYDALCREIYDPTTGITYPPLSCCNDPVYAERCSDPTAPKVIWAIQATQKFNNDMYLSLREAFKQNRLNLLISEIEYDENMKDVRAYESLDLSEKIFIQKPYIHTSLLINELINLEYESKGDGVRVHEKSGMRKDRVSSVGYNNYVMQQLEHKLRNNIEENDWSNYMSFKAPQRTRVRRW